MQIYGVSLLAPEAILCALLRNANIVRTAHLPVLFLKDAKAFNELNSVRTGTLSLIQTAVISVTQISRGMIVVNAS
jgi:hypothetical protein